MSRERDRFNKCIQNRLWDREWEMSRETSKSLIWAGSCCKLSGGNWQESVLTSKLHFKEVYRIVVLPWVKIREDFSLFLDESGYPMKTSGSTASSCLCFLGVSYGKFTGQIWMMAVQASADNHRRQEWAPFWEHILKQMEEFNPQMSSSWNSAF